MRPSTARAPASIIVGTAGIGRPICCSRTFSPTSGTPYCASWAAMASIDRFGAGVFCARPHAIAGARLRSDGVGNLSNASRYPGSQGALVFSHRLGDNEMPSDCRQQGYCVREAWGMEISQPQPGAVTATGSGPSAPPPRHLAAGEGAGWWGEGWRIFCAAPAVWIGIFVVFVVVSIALVLVPIIGSLAHTLLTPVFAGGVMLGCHALARGEPLRVGHLFEGFQGGRFGPLCILGLLALAILFVAATVMVATIFL